MQDPAGRLTLEAKQFRLLAEELNGVMWSMDRELRFLTSEGQGLDKLGLERSQVVGMRLDEYLSEASPSTVAMVREAHERALAGRTGRYTLELMGGVWQCRVDPLVIDGEPAGCVGVAFDISELRALKRSSAMADRRLDFHLDNSPLGMVEWNAEFRVSGWSRGCEAIFGWTAAEVVDNAWDDWRFVYEDDLERVGRIVDELVTGVTPRNVCLNRNHTADGRVVWCEWFNSVMLDDDGGLHSIVSHVQDVTEREEAKRERDALNRELEHRVAARTAELSEANARLERREREIRIVTNHLPALIAYVDRDERYRFVNTQYEAWYGQSPDRLAGRTVREVIGERSYGLLKPHLDRVLRGERINVQGIAYVPGEDEPRRVQSRLVPDATPEGEVAGFYSLVTDVTGFARVEEQFRLVSAAIDQVSEFVVITDADIDAPGPRVLFANRAFYGTTGFTPDEVVGRSPRILQGPKTDRATLDRLRAALRRGASFSAETVNYRKDGGEYTVAWHIAPVRGADGAITNWVSIQRDVTEQRRLEEAGRQRDTEMAHAARLSTLGEMASGIAHEVNQPLSAIANYASGCLRRLDDGETDVLALRTALAAIERQASRSGEVIRRVRAFASRREQQRERVEVAEMVGSVLTLLEADTRRLGARIVVEGVERCGRAWVDRVQVEQVLVNLIRNAFDAFEGLDPDRRVIDVRAALERGSVRIDVVDRGRGFDAVDADRLFEPFYSTKSWGMGMGLNISESLMQALGGRIEGRRNVGPGATFSIWVPLGVGHERRQDDESGAMASSGVSPRRV